MSGFNLDFKFDKDGFERKIKEAAKKKFREKLESMLPEILKEDPTAIITEDENGFPQLEAKISKKLRDKLNQTK